jgi:hypothetical protein
MTPMIRGYSVKQQAYFLETQFDPGTRERLLATLPDDIRRALPQIKPAEWYPRTYSVALLRAIASANSEEKAVFDDLVRCGKFIATEATNTFLKLMMKVLTPTLFAKKIPELWERDQKGGRFEVDVSEVSQGKIGMKLCDVSGFEHIGIVSIGWIAFGMEGIGKGNVNVKQTGWSLINPGPTNVEYAVTWS